ncbi:DUF1254 domain-containing protein [Sandaracinobacter sp. RS1-74]|uniref:DUF1254 domain-containing protein n=1 Tax=Sandaracinobacteroides sayramensis TaxID=2913411 RepID=UPI001EDAAECC|nr:DUF1254 domain-containing protein [Sandaracinobacteroides sayramensis]MCG2841599.1 DUF1254 domain-containing protein [Sandaracinobacteroides sayramensis]
MAAGSIPVTPENFSRAESDLYFSNVVKNGGFGKFDHTREVAPLDKQSVIRLNRDTLYSSVVIDLDAGPAAITLPETGDRFVSLQLIDEDQYTYGVFYGAGRHELTREKMGTRYVVAAVRTLVNPADPADVAAAHAVQDGIQLELTALGSFEIPNWDSESQNMVRSALLTLAETMPDTNRMYGKREDVDPVRFLIGSALGWGANPPSEALYLNVTPEKNDGSTVHELVVGDVPVDGFWSVSLYNAEGYYQKNDLDHYTFNNLTAKKSADGKIRIRFGGSEGDNILPIMPGWNYMVRLYRPRPEILDGSFVFPVAKPLA